MKIAYLAYPVLGYPSDVYPEWVKDLKEHVPDVFFYDPREPFQDGRNLSDAAYVKLRRLVDALHGSRIRQRRRRAIRNLPNWPLEVLEDFNTLPSSHFVSDSMVDVVVFRDLYVLARSDLLILDGDNPSASGETAIMACWANVLDIPVLTVADTVLQHPHLRRLSTALVARHTVSHVAERLLRSARKSKASVTPEVAEPKKPDDPI